MKSGSTVVVVHYSRDYRFLLVNARTKGGATENKIKICLGLVHMLGTRLDGKPEFKSNTANVSGTSQLNTSYLEREIIHNSIVALSGVCKDHIKSI